MSLHPLLRVPLSFARVPDVHDGFAWTVYLARSTTAGEAVQEVVDRFGLVKSLPVPAKAGGDIEYVLEELRDGSKCSLYPLDQAGPDIYSDTTRLSPDTSMSTLIEQSQHSSQPVQCVFCVPDEWYRRSSTNSRITSVSMSPSESTLKRLSELEEAEETEGTEKVRQSPQASAPASPMAKRSSDGSGGTFSSRRFSSIFDGWLGGAATSDSPVIGSTTVEEQKEEESSGQKPKRPIVSEPVALEVHTASASDSEDESGLDENDFEQMIVSVPRLSWYRNINWIILGRSGIEGRKARGHAKPPSRPQAIPSPTEQADALDFILGNGEETDPVCNNQPCSRLASHSCVDTKSDW